MTSLEDGYHDNAIDTPAGNGRGGAKGCTVGAAPEKQSKIPKDEYQSNVYGSLRVSSPVHCSCASHAYSSMLFLPGIGRNIPVFDASMPVCLSRIPR